MASLPFHHIDVFTSERFGGNPLAVFLDADDLDGDTMQRIAREMNLSESVFILEPQAGGTRRIRIFTPGSELPFAGHPTIGATYVLGKLGEIAEEGTLETEAGPIAVRREGDICWMTPPAAEPLEAAYDRAGVAQAIGLPVSAIMMPPQTFGGRGVQFLCVLLDTQMNVDWVMLDRRDLIAACGDSVGNGNVLIAHYAGGKAYTRMFAATESAIGEDPATGSSVAPLCAALGWWRALDQSRSSILVEQGTAMGRRSELHAQFVVEGTYVQQITVGGSCVPVYESTLQA